MTYVDDMIEEKGLKQKTIWGYTKAWEHYSKATGMETDDLINEAYQEEIDHTPNFQRKIKKHLVDYKKYLMDQGMMITSVNKNLELIVCTYSYFELWTPKRYKVKNVAVKECSQVIEMDDIRLAFEAASDQITRAAMLFILSSGCRIIDTLNISVQDFLDATMTYHHSDDIQVAVNRLLYRDDVIPRWYIKSVKTNKMYHTFNSPEATKQILLMIKPRLHKLQANDKLFNVSPSFLSSRFKTINTNMNWGKRGTYNYFRGHALRKTFSTILEKAEVNYNCRRLMLSHTIDVLDATYVDYTQEQLYNEYLKALPYLTIRDNVEVIRIEDKDTSELKALREDYEALEQKLFDLQQLLSYRIKE